MNEFGLTLRKAREEKGLTTRQVADKTHMMVQMVEDLENENFSKIAAPIYGRGFVKLYCEAVGIADPKPLVLEFMEIFNGNKAPSIRMRQSAQPPVAAPQPPVATSPVAAPEPPAAPEPASAPVPPPEPAPVQEPAPAPVAAPEPARESLPKSEPISKPEPEPAPERVNAVPPVSQDIFHLEQEFVKAPADPFRSVLDESEPLRRKPSRYVAPTPIDEDPDRPKFKISIPPAAWRILALFAVAGLMLWGIVAGVRALYRLTMHAPEAEQSEQQATGNGSSADALAKNKGNGERGTGNGDQKTEAPAPRKPMDLPPLYID